MNVVSTSARRLCGFCGSDSNLVNQLFLKRLGATMQSSRWRAFDHEGDDGQTARIGFQSRSRLMGFKVEIVIVISKT